MRSEHILVTGGTGFVGSHILDALSKEYNYITALVRKDSNLQRFSKGNINFIYGDLCDSKSLDLALQDIDIVIHSAALMSDRDELPKSKFYEINVKGTENLIRSCLNKKELKQFIHISTVGVYGSTENGPAKESDDYGKILSDYEWSKMKAEEVVLKYLNQMPITIIRLGQLYGPRMIYGWTNVIDMIYRDKMKIIGKGNSLIQLTHIDDIINGLKLVIDNERCHGQIFNMCGENSYKLNDVFGTIAEILGKSYPKSVPYYPVYILAYILKFIPNFVKPKPLILLTPHRAGFFKSNHIYDISKAKKYFNYNPTITLKDGMKKMIEWYLSEFIHIK
jgi:nucleoside-diphosphate-sugar epimerase